MRAQVICNTGCNMLEPTCYKWDAPQSRPHWISKMLESKQGHLYAQWSKHGRGLQHGHPSHAMVIQAQLVCVKTLNLYWWHPPILVCHPRLDHEMVMGKTWFLPSELWGTRKSEKISCLNDLTQHIWIVAARSVTPLNRNTPGIHDRPKVCRFHVPDEDKESMLDINKNMREIWRFWKGFWIGVSQLTAQGVSQRGVLLGLAKAPAAHVTH